MRRIIIACAIAGVLSVAAFGQGVDPLVGTWKFNVEKSTSTLPLAKSMTLTISGEGQTRTLTAEGMDGNSQPFKIVYQHIYDGQPHPTTGDPNIDSSAYARIGNTVNVVRFKMGSQQTLAKRYLFLARLTRTPTTMN